MAIIRKAELTDLPALLALLQTLFNQESEFHPDPARQAAGLRAILGNSSVGEIFVVEQDGVVQGMASLLYTVSTALGGPVAWLEDVVVNSGNRGQGHGRLLMESVLAHAQTRGCLRVTLLTDASNQGAIRFYSRHGFVSSDMQPMRRVF